MGRMRKRKGATAEGRFRRYLAVDGRAGEGRQTNHPMRTVAPGHYLADF
jgi:hypothetical protein